MAKTVYAFIAVLLLMHVSQAGAFQAANSGSAPVAPTIAPGPLDDALAAYAKWARVQLLYSPELVARRRSGGLRTNPAVAQALAELLRGTGLTAVAVNANTYLLQTAPRPVAQAPAPKPRPAPGSGAPTTPTQLEAIQVTGSRIPRTAFQGSTPLTVITREQIRSSGHQTLFDLLRLMPGMTGHHPRDVATQNGDSQVPSASAASSSLYSLGPRATLFLVNGRRMASYGVVSTDLGALADLNGIPLSMVERVEILRGGASAIYGADAMAGVVNIILKKDYEGTEIGAMYGVSERGDAEQQRISANFGVRTPNDGNVFLSVDHFSRNPLVGNQRSWATNDLRAVGLGDRRIPFGYNLGTVNDVTYVMPLQGCRSRGTNVDGRPCSLDIPRYTSLQPGVASSAFYGYYRQPINDRIEAYADFRATRVSVEMQNPPFYGLVDLPEDHPDALRGRFAGAPLIYAFTGIGPVRNRSIAVSRDATVGVKGFGGHWNWELSATSRSNDVTNRIDGLIRYSIFEEAVKGKSIRFNTDAIAPTIRSELSPPVALGGEMSLDSVAGTVNGGLFNLPGGEVTMAAGFEFRHEHLVTRPDGLMEEDDLALSQQAEARTAHRDTSALYAEFNLPLHRRLSTDLAWRLDRNQGYGDRVSPKLGVKWNVTDTLTLRGNVAEGYRAPTLFELRRPLSSESNEFIPADDFLLPCRNEYMGQCLVATGSVVNPDLQPETSTSRSLGLIWSPTDRFNLSVDRYRIRRRHEIAVVNALRYPELYPNALVRDENGALTGINTYLDNTARTDVSGWEIDAEYRFDTQRAGRFSMRLNGHYLDRLIRQPHPELRALDYAGFDTPDRTVLGSLQWGYGNWITTLNLRYMGQARLWTPGFECSKVRVEAGRCRTPSSTMIGLNVAYGGFNHWLLSLNVNNLGDHTPVKYDAGDGGYSIVDDDPVGRYFLFSALYRF